MLQGPWLPPLLSPALPNIERGCKKCKTSSFWWSGHFGSSMERGWDGGESRSPGTGGARNLSALQAQPTHCSSCIWVTRGRAPPAPAAHVWPWPGCVRSRASLPGCRMRLLSRSQRRGLREGKGTGQKRAERPSQPHRLGCTARQ